MPSVYLSPSVQQSNLYVTGETEEEMMNKLADAIVPYFVLNGITYRRNRPDMTLGQVIADSNRGNYDLHLALHSNAAPEGNYGGVRGSIAFYNSASEAGRRDAEIYAENLRRIYPLTVRAIPSNALAELNGTRAPAVLLEIAYHDNPEDAAFIKNNLQALAENIAGSTAEIFGKTLIPVCISGYSPAASYRGGLGYARICPGAGTVYFRAQPEGAVIASYPEGTQFVVTGPTLNGWTPVRRNATDGYISAQYLCICNNPALPFSARLGRVNTGGGSLNIRGRANLSAPVLTTAPDGAPIIILASNDDFYRVLYQGTEGFASRQFVTPL